MTMLDAPVDDYTRFKQTVATLLPIRLDDYKRGQMERRIRDLARKHNAATLADFTVLLRSDKDVLREFERHITINVSEFYRNPEAFDYLDAHILPQLLAGRQGLQIWSAGCSYGAEPFTLAMLLDDKAPRLRHAIYATDIDRDMLARARSGTGFTAEDIQHLPARLRERYIVRGGSPHTVAPEILRMVRFDRFDLLQDQPAASYDLIACRNVVIYFTDEAKNRLYKMFANALRPGGFLFIGATEVIGGAGQFGLRYVAPCFYQKAG